MMVYVRLRRLGALHFECCRAYTGMPFFSRQRCGSEIIFDMPFCRLIVTPAERLSARGSGTDAKADWGISADFTGVAKGEC